MSLQGILLFSFRALSLALPVTFAFVVFRLALSHFRGEKPRWTQEAIYGVFCCYLVSLLQITLIRGGVHWEGLFSLQRGMNTVQLIPLIYTFTQLNNGLWAFIYPVAGNMIWFLPLGLLMPVVKPSWGKFQITAATGLCLSCFIEAGQWLLGTGISDIDDVIFNLSGTLAGYLLYLMGMRIYRHTQGKKDIPTS